MVGKHGTKKVTLSLVTSFFVLLSCTKIPKQSTQEQSIPVALQSGDLILRKGTGYFSDIFKRMASRDKRFSHIGIISKERDSIFVYHIEADEFTGEGVVLREEVNHFLQQSTDHAFYANAMDTVAKQAMLVKAKAFFEVKVVFDLNFNAADDDKLYCSELVAKCINYGMDSIYIQPTLNWKGHLFYGLDDIYSKAAFSEIGL
ncbi:YiiX/YebB-like N1pC/P60 family cysteine hydrolase [Myroides sp. C15-4]|uniref:YiiX/YebB-like N1pC/P60 family cysteine hydrolase n=1 Tax=Myroides sp. C15-4 TaxID=3400532 RepID=UPI003D2F701C